MHSRFINPAAFAALLNLASAGATGTTFFVVGDYGEVVNTTAANMLFDAINDTVGAATPDTINAAEFFVSTGDNIYPAVPTAPTVTEFETMLALFQRPNLSSLPVYAIRGNHDCYFGWSEELQLSMTQSQWLLPAFYYEQMVPVGNGNEVMGMLFVDSVLMLCSDYTTALLQETPLTDPDHI